MKPHRLAIVASHVIQYQDPFFRLVAEEPDIDLTVFYCSMQGFAQYRDEDMLIAAYSEYRAKKDGHAVATKHVPAE